jgi:hypothetical protein
VAGAVGIRAIQVRQGAVVFLGAAAWTAQLLIGYELSDYACAPHRAWRAAPLPGWGWLRPGLVALNLIAVLVCLGALALALGDWRRGARTDAPALDAAGIRKGRARYLAIVGVVMNLGFLLAVLLDSVILAGAPFCLD